MPLDIVIYVQSFAIFFPNSLKILYFWYICLKMCNNDLLNICVFLSIKIYMYLHLSATMRKSMLRALQRGIIHILQ